jgi:hypothetical protein
LRTNLDDPRRGVVVNGFISRRRLAALLGVKTATVGSWDRRGRGVGGRGPIYLGTTNVIYRQEDVEAFLRAKADLPPAFVAPQERAARAAARLGGRSGVPKAPTASTSDNCGRDESAATVAAEREGEP